MKAEVTGLDKANAALEDELRKMGKLSERFVTKAMISISANTLPMIPVDSSFLVNSEYRKVDKLLDGFVGELGYGADYASYVHDAPGTLQGLDVPRDPNNLGRGNVWDPTGEPEFLAKGVEAFISDDLDAILRQEMLK